MAIHYFHCTDGVDLIIDRRGRDARQSIEVRDRARAVAEEIMRAVPSYREWEDWAVHVYDERGEIEIVSFVAGGEDRPSRPDVAAERRAPQNAKSLKAGSTEPFQAPW